MAFLLAVLIFVTTFLLCVVLQRFLQNRRRNVAARIESYLRQPSSISTKRETEVGPLTEGWRPLLRRLGSYLESPRWSSLLEQRLVQGGVPLRGGEFMVLVLLLAVTLAILGGKTFGGIVWGATGLLLGLYLPLLVLRIKIRRRAKAFNDQLCDALVLISNSLRTGYSFLQAIDMVAQEMPRPISDEFSRVLREMNFGVGTEAAMNNMAKRVASDDLDLAVTAVLIQRQVGGNLAEVLDSIASTIRERIRIKGQIKTLTAQGRISGLIISLLPIGLGLMIFLINPGYIKVLFTHPLGKLLITVGIISQLIGIWLIRKIVNIDL